MHVRGKERTNSFSLSVHAISPRFWRKNGDVQNPSCWNSVWSFNSRFGEPCKILVLVHCLIKSRVNTLHLPGRFRVLHAPFCWQALWRCWSFSRRTWHLPTLAKVPILCLMTIGLLCLIANLPDLNPIENVWGIVKRKMRHDGIKGR